MVICLCEWQIIKFDVKQYRTNQLVSIENNETLLCQEIEKAGKMAISIEFQRHNSVAVP